MPGPNNAYAMRPQYAQAIVTKRLPKPPVTAPSRAAFSSFADPAIVMLACDPAIPSSCTKSSAQIEYHVYSEAMSPPKRLNITSGTFSCNAAAPPSRHKPNGIKITDISTTKIACTASTTAEALRPPSMINTATRPVETR